MRCCSDDTYLITSIEMESSFALFCCFIFFLILIFFVRILWVINSKRIEACLKREEPVKTMVVIGSGGHTMEMLQLLSRLPYCFSPKLYIIAETDSKSVLKVLNFEKALDEKNEQKSKVMEQIEFEIKTIPRSREVGQSYFTSIFSTLYSSLFSFCLVLKEKPDLILCNGPGTCVPPCLSGFLLKVLLIKDIKTVYVESICRVKTLSLSAKILYYFVDRLIVQWPDLYKKYQRTVYLGRIV